MIRLVLVDDHILVRQSIQAFLKSAGLDVVGEAGTGAEAVQLVNQLQPDVVILDIHLPQMSGIEAARQIRQQSPYTHIIALTAYNEKVYQRALHDVGAKAFVLKTAELSELLRTIQQVVSEDTARSVRIAPANRDEPRFPLTEREIEVLICASRGWTNKQIGFHLEISDRTAQVHLQAVYHKLGVTNRTEAVLRAITLGIIQSNDGVIQ